MSDGYGSGWEKTRAMVYERDRATCKCCNRYVPPEHYECGHLVDRCVGGSNEPDNVAVMCGLCNRLKPLHQTLAEFDLWVVEWRANGGMPREFKEWLDARRRRREAEGWTL